MYYKIQQGTIDMFYDTYCNAIHFNMSTPDFVLLQKLLF